MALPIGLNIDLDLPQSQADTARTARVSGVLYICGGILLLVSLLLPHPEADPRPLYGIAAMALSGGLFMFRYAERLVPWMIHGVLGSASVLVSLAVLASGVPVSVYSTMFVWVVIVAACFMTIRELALQTGWLLGVYGLVLMLIQESGPFSSITQWVLTGFTLVVAGGATSWLVAGRRTAEQGLHREIRAREKLQRELEHMANHDPLTGVGNRRRLEYYLNSELDRARETGAPLCLVALDLNGFKQFNDVEGHAAGDRLLKAAASAWNAVLRADDLMIRMGGDEFLVVLPNCPFEVSERIAVRLRAAVPLDQTCSTGISCWDGAESAEALLARADEAMYGSKNRRPMSVHSP